MIHFNNLTKALHQKNYELLLNNYASFDSALLHNYFKLLFKTYEALDGAMPFLSFYKCLSWPFFLGEKLYNSFKSEDESFDALSKDNFALGLATLYGCDSIEAKAIVLFKLIDFNHDGIIVKQDMLIILSQFMAMSRISNVDDSFAFVDAFFNDESSTSSLTLSSTKMTIDQYNETIIHHNADVIYLLLLFIYQHKPFNDKSVGYYCQLMNNGDDTNQDGNGNRNGKVSLSSKLAFPSNNLFVFLVTQMNMPIHLEEDDLDELDSFESSLTSLITSAIRDTTMIDNHSNHTNDNNNVNESNGFKKAYSGLIEVKQSMLLSQMSHGENILRLNSHGSGSGNGNGSTMKNKPKIKQTKSQELSSSSIFRKPIDGTKPFVLTCFEVNKKRVMVKRKLVIISKDLFLFKYKEENNVKLTQVLPLKDIHLQSSYTHMTPSQESINQRDPRDDIELELHDIPSLTLISTHRNTLCLKSLFFRTESKRDKLREAIVGVNSPRNISDEYNLLHCIGKGTFGQVFKAEHKQTKEQVALKIMEKSYMNTKASFLEIMYRDRDISAFFKTFNHKGIIGIKETFETLNHVIIVQEYIPAGNLNQYGNHVKLSIDDSYEIMRQLIDSVCFLSKFGIIHRDIKKDNILIAYTHSGFVQTKLIDFSFSIICGYEETITGTCGTLKYLSPEMVSNRSYTSSIDIWTIGVVGYCLMTGVYPFESDDSITLTDQILNKNISESLILNTWNKSNSNGNTRRTLTKIILSCLHKEQSARPKPNELLDLVSGNQTKL